MYPGIQLQVFGLTQAPPFWQGGSHTAARIITVLSIIINISTSKMHVLLALIWYKVDPMKISMVLFFLLWSVYDLLSAQLIEEPNLLTYAFTILVKYISCLTYTLVRSHQVVALCIGSIAWVIFTLIDIYIEDNTNIQLSMLLTLLWTVMHPNTNCLCRAHSMHCVAQYISVCIARNINFGGWVLNQHCKKLILVNLKFSAVQYGIGIHVQMYMWVRNFGGF